MTATRTWSVPGDVVEVIDGDTVRVDIDLGPHGAHRSAALDLGWHIRVDPEGHVRLLTDVRIEGINAPEKNTPAGKTSKTALVEFLPAGTRVELVSKKLLGSTEKYGRVLGDLVVEQLAGSPRVDIASWLMDHGYALPWDGSGTRPV
jgi:endonuclease YncB( thermonuclease family)